MSVRFSSVYSILRRGALIPLIYAGWLGILCPAWGEKVTLNVLHMNDVYEITPLAGGTEAGLARVATVRQQLKAENPNTFTVLAGDLLSPSALGTAKIDGDRLAGEHIVDVMNFLGLDIATFGNHEFDLEEDQFRQRLAESRFIWFSGNVLTAAGEPWENVPDHVMLTVNGAAGTPIQVAFVGTTLASNPVSYVSYLDPVEQIRQQVETLKDQADIIVALTHLSLEQDYILAETIPEIDLILGGHEHENIQQWRGKDFTPIFKADANARTVYIHQLTYDTEQEQLAIQSRLLPINEAIAPDPALERRVEYWQQKAFNAFRESGFDPSALVTQSTVPLDGLESSVRNGSTTLTQLIAESMLTATDNVDLSMFNSGAIRIDDVLSPGAITQYDVIRMLPFGGNILTVTMRGALLERVLNQGLANQGTGGYLQTAGVTRTEDGLGWLVGDRPLDVQQTYRVAILDFLMTGNETGLDFLTEDNPDVGEISEGEDLRFALIQQLTQTFGEPMP